MFRPINLSVNHKRLKNYTRSCLIEGGDTTVFSWGAFSSRANAGQSACRVRLSARHLTWDSGWVETEEQALRYEGALPEAEPILLTVTLRDDAGEESAAAKHVFYNAAVAWKAGWIGLEGDPNRTVYLRREFSVDRPLASAVLYACGIGYQQISLNGERIDSAELDTAYTDYRKTCQYVTYPELGKRLRPGRNCLGAMLGAGWRHNRMPEALGHPLLYGGQPCFTAMLRLEYADGGVEWILSDESWQAGFGAHVRNDIFDGEDYDANRAATGWNQPGFVGFGAAQALPAPGGALRPMILNPIIEHNVLRPIASWPVGEDSYVLDFGKNIAGVLRVALPALEKGQVIALTHAEELNEDGTLYTAPLRSARARDTYTASGDGRDLSVWQPIFTYHGFRYARVDGMGEGFDPARFEAVELHTDMETHSSFRCGDPCVNAIHEACAATERANQHGILTDCPQRNERQGWMNDATVRFEETPYNFEIGGMFPKLVRDLMDIQDEAGAITCTAPFAYGNQPADPVCSSFLVAGLQSWLHEGNADLIREAFAAYEGWENCLLAHSEGYIVNYSYYGDWAGPAYACEQPDGARSVVTPGQFMSTGYSYFNCRLLERFAVLLERPEAQAHWHALAEAVGKAMLDKWYDGENAVMATGSQACQAFALWLGLIPVADQARAAARIHDELVNTGYAFTTGNLCTRYLLDVLSDNGYLEDAWALVTKKTYPSWGFMLEQEATTIWERFELKKNPGMNSHNHPMYGAVDYWFYAYLGGIRPLEDGYKRILIKPYMPEGLMSAQAVVDTVRGEVSVRWMKRYGKTHLHVTVPFGSTAVIEFMGKTREVGSGFHAFSVGDEE